MSDIERENSRRIAQLKQECSECHEDGEICFSCPINEELSSLINDQWV